MRGEVVKCLCGCGATTAVIKYDNRVQGLVAGEYRRYLKGHHLRKMKGVPACGFIVDEMTGCWNWKLKLDKKGYGRTKRNGRYVQAHVWMYELARGVISEVLEIDHLCRNTTCVNPDHLEAVTPTENRRRSSATKLRYAEAVEIKHSSDSPNVVAKRFGITPSNVSQIRRGFSWKDA